MNQPLQDHPYRLRMTIVAALAIGFGTLVFVAASGVLGIGLWSARENTVALLSDRAVLSTDLLVSRIRHHLDPVVNANEGFARQIAEGEIDIADDRAFAAHMRSALAAIPQATGMAFFSPDGRIKRYTRGQRDLTIIAPNPSSTARSAMIESMEYETEPVWGDLFWSRAQHATLLNRRAPVRRDGVFIGVLVTAVSLAELSRFLEGTEASAKTLRSFLLYGRDFVLAHRQMAGGDYAHSSALPIPSLQEIGDHVMADLWNPDRQRPTIRLTENTQGHLLDMPDDTYFVVYRRLNGYAAIPLTVGSYTALGHGGWGQEYQRMIMAAALGFGVVILSLIIAFWLGRRVARPIRALSIAADAIRDLRLDPAPTLPRSRLTELDDAARAFNTMADGLRWFELYVPRTLVRTLLGSENGSTAIASATRDVTVLFTDIRGFTTLAEMMSAEETAAFLNAHFSLLASSVEATDGTIDKYIGDSMMAFWGAPNAATDHALRACNAALAIRNSIGEANRRRAEAGEAPVRMGIGIHSGDALVGNIGAPGRVNYTLVGDVVNSAQRIEQLCKPLQRAEDDVTILVGDAVAQQIGDAIRMQSCGIQTIRGRDASMEIFRLV